METWGWGTKRAAERRVIVPWGGWNSEIALDNIPETRGLETSSVAVCATSNCRKIVMEYNNSECFAMCEWEPFSEKKWQSQSFWRDVKNTRAGLGRAIQQNPLAVLLRLGPQQGVPAVVFQRHSKGAGHPESLDQALLRGELFIIPKVCFLYYHSQNQKVWSSSGLPGTARPGMAQLWAGAGSRISRNPGKIDFNFRMADNGRHGSLQALFWSVNWPYLGPDKELWVGWWGNQSTVK